MARRSMPRSCPVVSPGRVGRDERGDGGGLDVAEAGELAGEDDRFRQVDPPGRQRRGDGRQPGDRGGEADQPVRGPAGQRQGRGDLDHRCIALAQVTGAAA